MLLLYFFKIPSYTRQVLMSKQLKGEFAALELIQILQSLFKFSTIKKKVSNFFSICLSVGVGMWAVYLFCLLFSFASKIDSSAWLGIFLNINLFYSVLLIIFKILCLEIEKNKIFYQLIQQITPILIVLNEDSAQKITVALNFSTRISPRYRTQVTKNYKGLDFAWLLWFYFLVYYSVICCIVFFIALAFGINLFELFAWDFDDIILSILIGLLPSLYIMLPILFIGFFLVGLWLKSDFGALPRIKTKYYQIPRMSLQAILHGGTAIQINIQHKIAKKIQHKYKYKPKNFQYTKKKNKIKSHTLTQVRVVFPYKKYGASSREYVEGIERNHKKAKVSPSYKIKQGENKSAVVFKDMTSLSVSTKKYQLTMPDATHLLDLIGLGIYRKRPKTDV